ncbi:hypothetical protein Dimus_017940, partial [Dionaea muscipula]
DQEDDAVNSVGHDLGDSTSQSVEHNDDNAEIEPEPEMLKEKRRGHVEDDDNILLSHKYQDTPESLEADEDMEVVDVTPRILEMDANTITFIGTDGIVYGIDDMEALVDMAIEDATNKLI